MSVYPLKAKYAAQTTTVREPVKERSGSLGTVVAYNPNGSVAYVQLFDIKDAASVTLGTTAPDEIIPVPAGQTVVVAGGDVQYHKGIALACTTTATGSTAPSTGLDVTIRFA